MIKNVLPFFLDGGVQSASLTAIWNGASSFVELTNGAGLIIGVEDSYGKPIKHGTMLVVTNRSSSSSTVNPTADFSSNDNAIILGSSGASVLFMFKGPSADNVYGEWVVLSKFQADLEALDLSNYALLTGADFTGNVTVSGNVGFNGASAQGKAAFVANATGTDAAAIDAIRDVLVSYGMMAAS